VPETKTYAAALVDALYDSLAEDPRVVLICGSVVSISRQRDVMDRLRRDFSDRISQPLIAEAVMAGIGAGAAMAGARPFVDFGTASFAFLGWSQIVNEAAVGRYMSNGALQVPVTYHMMHGVRGGGAPQHSHSPQAMLANVPGLEIVVPSTPADVYGLVRGAIASPNPTVVLSHMKLLEIAGPVPDGKAALPLGHADVKRGGRDATVVASSLMVHDALAAAARLAADGIEAEVVDLRTLAPLDTAAILRSVERTGRLVVVDETPVRNGVASDIAGFVAEHGFDALRAPIMRVGRADTPVPFSPPLEAYIAPNAARIEAAVRRVTEWRRA
jgi:acetoin:2,6-dichlorophenolindophenol oxidoreductase subunit beta